MWSTNAPTAPALYNQIGFDQPRALEGDRRKTRNNVQELFSLFVGRDPAILYLVILIAQKGQRQQASTEPIVQGR
jgi:hypothetical protein